jgi:cell division protein FtsB
LARAKRRATRQPKKRRAVPGELRRARLLLLGAVAVSAVFLFAWFPASSLLSQRSDLAGTESQLTTLHSQDAALAQEKKNLSDAGEIGRIAREQYQLVSPGQQAYEVLPPTGSTSGGTPYAGDPGSDGPVTPSAASELPPGSTTTTMTTPTTSTAAGSSGTATGGHPADAVTGRGASSQKSPGFVSRVVHALEFWR